MAPPSIGHLSGGLRDQEPIYIPACLNDPKGPTTPTSPRLAGVLRVAVLRSDLPTLSSATAKKLGRTEAGSSGDLFHFRPNLAPFLYALFGDGLIDAGLKGR